MTWKKINNKLIASSPTPRLATIGAIILTLHRILILELSFLNLRYEVSSYYIQRKKNVIRHRRSIPFRIKEDKWLTNVLDYLILYIFGFFNFLFQVLMVTPVLKRVCTLVIRNLSASPVFVRRSLSFAFGIIISYFIFFVFNGKDTKKSFIISFTIISVTLFTIVFAMSTTFRCVILLAIPKIIITQLRFVILYQISVLILSGPLVTIQANSQILSELALCSAKISYDITMEKIRETIRPLLVFVHSFQALVDEFGSFYKSMKTFLMDALNTIREIEKYLGILYLIG